MAEVEDDAPVVVGARVRLDGLKAKPELNGALGTVESFNEESGRFNVMVDDMREALALKVAALSVVEGFSGLVVGTRVRIAGVDKRPELNGQLATVQGFSGERCSVWVEDRKEAVALKPETLAVADSAGGEADAAADGSKVVRVECNGVMLKLTLTAKQMKKPLADAVLRPFLKAYSKKAEPPIDPPLDISNVRKVTLDSDSLRSLQVLNDVHIYSTEAVLEKMRGDIDFEVFLKDPKAEEAKPAAPAAPKVPVLPMDARVEIDGLSSAGGW